MYGDQIKIGICDDDLVYADSICTRVKEVCRNCQADVAITIFNSGEEVIDYRSDLDILILDEELSDGHKCILNGNDVRHYFQETFKKTRIICVTGHERYMQNSFGTNVVGFVTKGDESGRLENIFLNCVKRMNGAYEIMFIEADKHNTSINLYNGKCIVHKAKFECVASHFASSEIYIRCHRSYIINLYYVDRVEGDFEEFFLKDGRRIPIARGKKQFVRGKYLSYKEENFERFFGGL